jgi:uncharacterized protein YjiS (DUF1127 family)
MTIISNSDALSATRDEKRRIVDRIRPLGQWIGPIFRRLGAQLMKARLRLKSMHELGRLSEHELRDIGLTRVNLPGVTPGLPGGTTGRFI